jgi:uncharacterized protein (TIGR02145 family)
MKNILSVLTLLTVLISSGYAQDTVHVKTGWNIIGSVKDGAVPDVLSTIPDSIITTSFFGYEPGAGYASTDTLGKGLGYWVKVSDDGVIIFGSSGLQYPCGTKMVPYDDFTYHTVQIGSQCWLEENMRVGTIITGVTNQTNNGMLERYCYGDIPTNCSWYGGLYQWDEAMQYVTTPGARGICPPGWHIPTYAEIQTLSSTVGGDGNALKAVGQGIGVGAGTNTSGFSAFLSGGRYFSDGHFYNLDYDVNFWSSTEYDSEVVRYMNLLGGGSYIYLNNNYKPSGFSVRCLED